MEQLRPYQSKLEAEFLLNELPKGIVWTTSELATTTFSQIPIPAFTNRDLIYITPDLEEWKCLFLEQLEDQYLPDIRHYYETISDKHVLAILAHELTHHIDLFPDEFDDEQHDSIWFEEGMCEYLPRKYLFTDEEFNQIVNVERKLVEVFENRYGGHSLDDFGAKSYEGSLTSIMYDYWRSFLTVKQLVDQYNGDVRAVFDQYNKWHQTGREMPLTEYFSM